MSTYRVVRSLTSAGKFDVAEIGGGVVTEFPLSYDLAVNQARGLSTGKFWGDPFDDFRENHPRHAYAIDKMKPGGRDRWVTSIFLGKVTPQKMDYLWEFATKCEKENRRCSPTD